MYNLKLDSDREMSPHLAMSDCELLGTKTILENSSHGLRLFNKWQAYKKLSVSEKINIIIGTGTVVQITLLVA